MKAEKCICEKGKTQRKLAESLKAAESRKVRGAFSSFQSTRGFHDE
jgi:hypothetical protein